MTPAIIITLHKTEEPDTSITLVAHVEVGDAKKVVGPLRCSADDEFALSHHLLSVAVQVATFGEPTPTDDGDTPLLGMRN